MSDECQNCRFWKCAQAGPGEDVLFGECRRYPPTLFCVSNGIEVGETWTEYPVTNNNSWCGEFQPEDEGHVYQPQGELPPDLEAERRRLKGLEP